MLGKVKSFFNRDDCEKFYKLGKTLGQGSFATVRPSYHHTNTYTYTQVYRDMCWIERQLEGWAMGVERRRGGKERGSRHEVAGCVQLHKLQLRADGSIQYALGHGSISGRVLPAWGSVPYVE